MSEPHDPANLSPHLLHHADGLARCPWAGTDPLYVHYHDTDWGVPEDDSRALFEKLLLDGFQAGLAWITILRKRENFRAAFDGFRPEVMAGYGPDKVEALMADAGIVRNRSKIEASIRSAQAYLAIEARQGFSTFLWDFVDGQPLQNARLTSKDVPAETETSRKLSKALRAEGFNFVGPTIVYAFMQAVGMVNDHLVGCCRHEAVKGLVRGAKPGQAP
jgi:DNA-3-methyladenine glycosylase I